MRIAFLTDSYMRSPAGRLVLDPFRLALTEGLSRLGHTVSPFIVNDGYLEERGLEPVQPDGRTRLARDVAATSPDLVLTINRAGLCPEVLDLSVSHLASWYIDNVHTFPPELLQFGDRELVFFYGPRSAREPDGAPPQLPLSRRFYLPLGVDARVFRPWPELVARTGRKFNILFLGGYFSSAILWRMARGGNPAFYERLKRLFDAVPSLSSYAELERLMTEEGLTDTGETERRALLRGLLSARTGLERIRRLDAVRTLGLTIYGGNWEALIPEHFELLTSYAGQSVADPQLLAQLLSLSHLTINITHLQSRLCGGLNLRVFEALSTGTLLVNDYPEEVGEMFEEGVEFLGYRTLEELRERCAWALTEPERAQAIAQAGRRAVLAGHTLQHRIAELMRIIQEA